MMMRRDDCKERWPYFIHSVEFYRQNCYFCNIGTYGIPKKFVNVAKNGKNEKTNRCCWFCSWTYLFSKNFYNHIFDLCLKLKYFNSSTTYLEPVLSIMKFWNFQNFSSTMLLILSLWLGTPNKSFIIQPSTQSNTNIYHLLAKFWFSNLIRPRTSYLRLYLIKIMTITYF